MAKHIIVDNEGDKVSFTIKLFRGLKKGKGYEQGWTEEAHQFEMRSIDRIKRFLKFEYPYANCIIFCIDDAKLFKEIVDRVIPQDLPVRVNVENKNMYIFLNLSLKDVNQLEVGIETTFGEVFKGLDSIRNSLDTLFEITQ